MQQSKRNSHQLGQTSSATIRIRRYREKHRRIDYFPSPDVLAILEYHQTEGIDHCIAGIIDELVRHGHRTVTGNGGCK